MYCILVLLYSTCTYECAGYGISTKLWDYVFGTPILVNDELLVPVADELLGRPAASDADAKKLD